MVENVTIVSEGSEHLCATMLCCHRLRMSPMRAFLWRFCAFNASRFTQCLTSAVRRAAGYNCSGELDRPYFIAVSNDCVWCESTVLLLVIAHFSSS